MKIRNNFVSNSSSSSFIIDMKDLTPLQVTQIFDHVNLGREFGIYNAAPIDAWEVEVSADGTKLTGGTIQDNFRMEELFSKIGVSDAIVKWGDY